MNTRRLPRGQGLVEYIIMTALIGIAAIATFQYFGTTVRTMTAAIAQELSGGDGSASRRTAKKFADDAAGEAEAKHGLDSFTGNADK